MRRDYALESDCADCGQSEAEFRFIPTGDRICEACSEQYAESDLQPVASPPEPETCSCAVCNGFV